MRSNSLHAALAACLAATLGLGGCVTSGTTSGAVASGRAIDVLPASGASADKLQPSEQAVLRLAVAQPQGLADIPAVGNYALGVQQKLLRGISGGSSATQVYLVPSANFKAETGPSGGVFLTLGTLERLRSDANLQSEDHLAFILAHELAHVLLNHVNERAGSEAALRKLSLAAQIGMQVAGTKASVPAKERWNSYLLANAAGLEALESTLFPAWGRDQEYAADQLGIDLMVKAGYSPNAALDVISVINADEQEAERKRKAAQERLEQQMAERPQGSLGEAIGSASATARQQMAQSMQQILDELRNTHPLSDNRDDALRTYIAREYPTVRPKLNKDAFLKVMNRADVKAALKGYQELDGTLQSLAAKDVRGATRSYQAAVRSGAGESSYGAYVGYQLAEASGRANDAVPGLVKAAKHPYATLTVYAILGEHLERQSRYDAAYDLYRTADERLMLDSMIPQQIRLAKRLNRPSEVTALQVRCISTADRELMGRCSEAAK